jgi:hypothetical protein
LAFAGIATALGGLANPYERFSQDKQALADDFMWACG